MNPADNPTLLSDLPGHALFFECAAGHVQDVGIEALAGMARSPVTVGEAFRRARCRVCGERAVEYRIVFVNCRL